ncbi:hypothetical protein, partial [Neisseria gonorrhoeae]|uniref:hypothetical protein n=1 Tax=Neisseria gonorrhoeae TaxID=485 RepID=UPI00352FFEEC
RGHSDQRRADDCPRYRPFERSVRFYPHANCLRKRRQFFYSGLNLNRYSVASPCRTICTVCGFVALS